MARLEKMPEPQRSHIANTKLPTFDTYPWVDGPALNVRRIAIVSSAGLHRRDDRPFTFEPGDNYRIIPGDTAAKVLFAVKDRCLKRDDKMMQLLGKILLIPMSRSDA